jgi:hypothetical protein
MIIILTTARRAVSASSCFFDASLLALTGCVGCESSAEEPALAPTTRSEGSGENVRSSLVKEQELTSFIDGLVHGPQHTADLGVENNCENKGYEEQRYGCDPAVNVEPERARSVEALVGG